MGVRLSEHESTSDLGYLGTCTRFEKCNQPFSTHAPFRFGTAPLSLVSRGPRDARTYKVQRGGAPYRHVRRIFYGAL